MPVEESQEEEEEEEYINPAQVWRPFGAGIKRKRVEFVPASTADPSTTARQVSASRSSLSDRYLAITLGEGAGPRIAGDNEGREALSSPSTSVTDMPTVPPTAENRSVSTQKTKTFFCETCQTPIPIPIPLPVADLNPNPNPDIEDYDEQKKTVLLQHESSIAHQAGLQHSHPPSHLDRNRHGLKYLASYGWDPDARLGLGALENGIRAPLKARVKNDTLGLGVKLSNRRGEREQEQKPVQQRRLDAKGVRKQEKEERKKREKLHQMFYASVDVEKYLGG